MKLISDVGPGGGYGDVTGAHMAASASALTELARVATADFSQRDARPLYVRLSHFEHGAFLSPLLFGFWVLSTTGELVTRPTPPRMEGRPPLPAAHLRSVDAASPEHPSIYAVVANHPVPVQIEHTLAALSSLVARQEFVGAGISDVVTEIDRLTAEVDTRAITVVTDTLRSQGWRAAAEAVRARSEAAGLPLVVMYDPVLMDQVTLALRAPILRRIYNELPAVREAVDKVATIHSQGLKTVGVGSERAAAFARDLLDVGSTRTYLAHLARDAFVCGNGFLAFGAVPDEDIRLLPPELVRILEPVGPGILSVAVGDAGVIHKPVLHVTGAEQRESSYGLSVLEPFVQVQCEREVMLDLLEVAKAWDRPDVPELYRSDALKKVPLARRVLASLESKVVTMLGGPRTLRVQPPADLYFPGYEGMAPVANGLSMVTGEADAGTGSGERD
jgi:hypothetical protein